MWRSKCATHNLPVKPRLGYPGISRAIPKYLHRFYQPTVGNQNEKRYERIIHTWYYATFSHFYNFAFFISNNICFNGSYSIEILKPKRLDPELINGIKKSIECDFNFFKRCDLLNLDPSKQNVGLILSERKTDEALEYYSKSLRENVDILNGNFPNSSFRYNLLKISRKKIKWHTTYNSTKPIL